MNETNLACIGFCSPVVLVHGGVGEETCMDLLVTSADVNHDHESSEEVRHGDVTKGVKCVWNVITADKYRVL